jgi:phosphoglycerol transferase MdoB-like AlkP superfamily enzyme
MADSNNTWVPNLGLWLLGITFIVLKLTGVIDWSWWLVTLPFWGGIAVLGVVLISLLIVYAIGKIIGKIE